MEKVTPSG